MNKQMHERTFSPLRSERAGVSSTGEMTALKRLSPYSALVQNRYLLHESDGLVGEEKKISSSTHLTFSGWGPVHWTHERQINKRKT